MRYDRNGSVHWITIDRPGRRNAINAEVVAGIAAAQQEPAARAIVLTGAQFQAQQLLDWGIVNCLAPRAELDERLNWLLDQIVDKSPTAVRLGKQAFNPMRDMSLVDALEYAQAMVPVMSTTADAAEGIAAFRDKRQPVWIGH